MGEMTKTGDVERHFGGKEPGEQSIHVKWKKDKQLEENQTEWGGLGNELVTGEGTQGEPLSREQTWTRTVWSVPGGLLLFSIEFDTITFPLSFYRLPQRESFPKISINHIFQWVRKVSTSNKTKNLAPMKARAKKSMRAAAEILRVRRRVPRAGKFSRSSHWTNNCYFIRWYFLKYFYAYLKRRSSSIHWYYKLVMGCVNFIKKDERNGASARDIWKKRRRTRRISAAHWKALIYTSWNFWRGGGRRQPELYLNNY